MASLVPVTLCKSKNKWNLGRNFCDSVPEEGREGKAIAKAFALHADAINVILS